MTQRKITSASIADDAVASDQLAANLQFPGDYIVIPSGTTAQRPESASVGMLRYNTTLGFVEQYTGDGWQGIAAPPSVTAVSPSTYNGEQGTQFTVNGSNFDTNVAVKFITSQGTEYNAATISRVNASQLLITTAQDFTVADEPLKVKVINGSGLSYTLDNAIDCGSTPTWSTASGTVAEVIEDVAMSPVTLVATDPDTDATISYSITSGSLPAGLSFNTSTGVISGTPNVNDAYSPTTTHNFSVTATDNATNSSTRAFSIIRKWLDGSTEALAAPSGSYIRNIGITTDGTYWLKPVGGSGTATQAYVMNSIHGGGWVKFIQYYNNSSVGAITSGQNLNGSWVQSARNLNSGVLNRTDVLALQSTGTNTGFLMTRYSGPNGKYRYWRYVEGSTTNGHHPRVSRIVLVEPDGTQRNAFVFTSDNCSDIGTYQVGTTGTYDAGTQISVAHVKEYHVTTADRGANFTLQGSNNGSSWTTVLTGNFSANTCGLLDTQSISYPADVGGLDPLFNFDVGIGGFFLTSGTLDNFGSSVDPTATYDLKVDKTGDGSWDTVVRYTNDTRGLCTHTPVGSKIWYSDHNYNGTLISGSYPQGVGAPQCWSIGTNAVGTNLHFMSGQVSGQSNGELYYGYTDTASLALWIK